MLPSSLPISITRVVGVSNYYDVEKQTFSWEGTASEGKH